MSWPFDGLGDDNPLGLQADETLARQLDTGFAGEVRGLVHDPATGLAGGDPEAALAGIADTIPLLAELKDRYLAQATGPRQKALLEPLIDRRLERAGGELGRIVHQATSVLDDRSVAERLADLQRDASLSWQDPAHLRLLGRTAVDELRYQGERKGWDAGRTDTAVRAGLSDLYAGAVEAAIGQDRQRAATLYAHARDVIQPERQAIVERRIERAREEQRVTEIVGGLADSPDDPMQRPDPDDYQARAAGATPPDASPEVQAQVTRMARIEQARADRAWQAARGRAAVGALDWLAGNPTAPLMAMPTELRDGLSPEQTERLEATAINGGRVVTDRDLYEKLDDQAVRNPEDFTGLDLTQYRLSLGDSDYDRLTKVQQALAEGKPDPAFERHRLGRLFLGEGLRNANLDPGGAEARTARQQIDRLLGAFGTVEGKPPTMADIRSLVGDVLPRGEGDPNIVRTSGGEPVEANGNMQIAQQQEPAKAGQETGPPTKSTLGSSKSQAATMTTATHPGKRVVLPNGKNVPSSEDPQTEFLMSPVEDLSEVVAYAQTDLSSRHSIGNARNPSIVVLNNYSATNTIQYMLYIRFLRSLLVVVVAISVSSSVAQAKSLRDILDGEESISTASESLLADLSAYYRHYSKVRLGRESRLANGVAWRLHTDLRTGLSVPRLTWMPDRDRLKIANTLFDAIHGELLAWYEYKDIKYRTDMLYGWEDQQWPFLIGPCAPWVRPTGSTPAGSNSI